MSTDADARASSRDDEADEAAYTKNMCSSLLKYFTFAITTVPDFLYLLRIFGTDLEFGVSRFLGIKFVHGKPRRPRTQGMVEHYPAAARSCALAQECLVLARGARGTRIS